MAAFAFAKKKDAPAGPETKAMDMMPGEDMGESKPDAEPDVTPADLGKRLLMAIKSGDGEATFEAFISTMEYQHRMDGSTAAHDKMKALEGE